MAGLLGLSTLAVAMGKLLLGPIVDSLGSMCTLQIALTILSGLVFTISFRTTSLPKPMAKLECLLGADRAFTNTQQWIIP